MKVEFRNSFTKDLRRLRDKSVKARIKATIEQIEEANDLKEVSNVRKLNAHKSGCLLCKSRTS